MMLLLDPADPEFVTAERYLGCLSAPVFDDIAMQTAWDAHVDKCGSLQRALLVESFVRELRDREARRVAEADRIAARAFGPEPKVPHGSGCAR